MINGNINNVAVNNYVLQYVPENLPWYKRDGLFTWYDQTKCKEFLEDPDAHFKNKKIVNFDIIQKSIRGEKIPENNFKNYQTVKMNRVRKYPKQEETNFLSVAFRTNGKDLYFEKEVVQKPVK